VSVTIAQYNLSNATIANISAVTYNGSAHTPTPGVTVPIPSGSTTTLTNGTHFTYGYSNNTNAGTATVTITAKAGTNYTGSKSKDFTINKKAIQATKSNYNGNYDGSSHTITLSVTEPTSATTIYYSTSESLTSSNYTTKGSTTIPSRTDAGSTTVYWYVHTTNGNYSDINGSNTITVNTIANTLSVSAKSLTYNGSAQALVTASNAQGSVYYAVGTQLTSSNYSTAGSTTIPSRTDA